MFPSIIQVPEINSMRLFVFKWTPKDDLAVLKISGKSSYTPYSFQTISLCVNHQQTMYLPIALLQLTIRWYKIRHAGGQAHYYSRTGTSKQRQVKLHWFRSLCFNVPVRE